MPDTLHDPNTRDLHEHATLDVGARAVTSLQHARVVLDRLQACEAEQRDALRWLRCGIDDLSAAIETGRQLRAELTALLSADEPLPRLIVGEVGGCGRLERCDP